MIPGIIAGGMRRATGPRWPSGYIASAAAGTGTSAAQRSSTRVDLPTWEANFGQTINEGLFLSALTSPGDTGVSGSKIVANFELGQTWGIYSNNAHYGGDEVTLRAEFLNASNAVVAAIQITSPERFKVRLAYGPSLSSLTLAPTAGAYPQIAGTLSFDATGMSFAPGSTSTGIQAWLYAANFASVVGVRFSNMRAFSGSPSSGGVAYVTVFRNP